MVANLAGAIFKIVSFVPLVKQITIRLINAAFGRGAVGQSFLKVKVKTVKGTRPPQEITGGAAAKHEQVGFPRNCSLNLSG